MSTALRQTTAMFVDAYRELAAGKLFWITLGLSALVAGAFAAVGIDEESITVLWFRLPFPITSEQLPPDSLYKLLFFQLGLGIWLTWIATILALVTTAGIIPSLVSSGVIDSMVAKPITRTRLFLTRFATGMVFAALQVTLFSTAAFLVLGFRGDLWLWSTFLAIPIVVVFYSYLFAIMTLAGLITKSTITSLLVTLLIWFCLFIVNFVDSEIIEAHERSKISIATIESRIERVEADATETYIRLQRGEGNDLPESYQPTREELGSVNVILPMFEQALVEAQETESNLRPWSRGVFLLKTILPKTGETIGLLSRYVLSEQDANAFLDFIPEEVAETSIDEDSARVNVGIRDTAEAVSERYDSRSLAWILGTSLLFEAFILGIACFIFSRRDF